MNKNGPSGPTHKKRDYNQLRAHECCWWYLVWRVIQGRHADCGIAFLLIFSFPLVSSLLYSSPDILLLVSSGPLKLVKWRLICPVSVTHILPSFHCYFPLYFNSQFHWDIVTLVIGPLFGLRNYFCNSASILFIHW